MDWASTSGLGTRTRRLATRQAKGGLIRRARSETGPAQGIAMTAIPCRVRFHLIVVDPIVTRKPLGSVSSKARVPHSVSCGSELS